MKHMLHHDTIRSTLANGPGAPAHEAVNCVATLGLAQGELVSPPVELVAAILEPVWPGDQHLPPTRRGHFVGPVSVDELSAARGGWAEPAANLDDDRLLISSCNGDLLARRRIHPLSRHVRFPGLRSPRLLDMSAERTGSRIVVHSDVPGGAFRAVSVAIVSKKTSARG